MKILSPRNQSYRNLLEIRQNNYCFDKFMIRQIFSELTLELLGKIFSMMIKNSEKKDQISEKEKKEEKEKSKKDDLRKIKTKYGQNVCLESNTKND